MSEELERIIMRSELSGILEMTSGLSKVEGNEFTSVEIFLALLKGKGYEIVSRT